MVIIDIVVVGKVVVVVMVFSVVDSRWERILGPFVLVEVKSVGVGLACSVSLESGGVVDLLLV